MNFPFLSNQEGGKKLILPAILISAGFLIAGLVLAYDSRNAHRALTYEAAEFYNLNTPSGSPSKEGERITPEEIGWMMDGAEQEDTPPRWINHFFNPITGEGWKGEGMAGIPSDTLKLISKLALSSRDPISAKNWAKNRSAQSDYAYYGGDQTWQNAVESYVAGNKKEAFEALGHIMHLLEDMTVPDHTRNDTHAGLAGDKGSPYENWAKNYTAGKEKNLQIAETLAKAGQKPKQFPIIENYFDDNANYSSKNFFSEDTISGDYPTLSKSENFSLNSLPAKKLYTNDGGGDYLAALIFLDANNNIIKTINDNEILNNYWQRLSRQAVISGAGAINLFFQDVEQQKKINPNPAPQQITSNSKIFSPFGALVKIGNAVNNFVLGAKTIAADILPSSATTVDIDNLPPPAPLIPSLPPENPGETPKNTLTESLTTVNDSVNKKSEPPPTPPQNNPSPPTNDADTSRDTATVERLYVSRVVDGDTVTLNNGKDVRLIGMNSPEIGQKCADEATQTLKNLILGKYITLEKDASETDKYGRLLRYIYLDGALINAEMVKNGFARVMTIPPDTKYADAFRAVEDEAKFFHRGCLYKSPSSFLPLNKGEDGGDVNDKGPYYGGSSYAGGSGPEPHPSSPFKGEEAISTPENSATSTPDVPPIITPTSTPDAATSTPPAPEPPPPETPTSTPPEPEPQPAQDKILISEVQIAGAMPNDEFIELYNTSSTAVDISNWKLIKKSETVLTKEAGKEPEEYNLVSKFPANSVISPNSYFLIVPKNTVGAHADTTYTNAGNFATSDDTIILKDSEKNIIDKLGFGLAADYEGAPALNPPDNQSLTRQNFIDTDNNFNDFIITSSTPQGSSSTLEIQPEPPPPPPPPPPEPIITCATSTYETHDNSKGAIIPDVKRLPAIYANVDTILQANTTYYIDYQIYVKPKARLIIPEGVVIKFGWWRRDGWYDFPAMLDVAGSLEINGTKNNPVIFTSFRDDAHGAPINATTSTPAPGDWGALQIESKKDETIKIQNAKFYYGGGHQDVANNFGGAIFINLSDADIDISDVEVAQSISGIYSRAKSSSQPEILNSNFENNKYWGAALEKDSAIKMVGNTMKCNGFLGGVNSGGGAYIRGGSPDIIIENNNFLTNETMGLQYVPDKNENLTATNNYWGHSSGPFHATANPAGLGNAVSNNVNFSPWSNTKF